MKIAQLYTKKQPVFSFELFPPKTPEGEQKLYQTVKDLKKLNPSFISVTYGAMGSTQDNTLRIVSAIKNDIGVEAAAHLTCVGQNRDQLGKVISELKEKGIENIVALRGDPPKGETEFKPVPNGFRYASDLVQYIRSQEDFANHFSLAVAGYPEGHLECRDLKLGLEHLKLKIDQGADVVITQLFFDNDDFFRFRDSCVREGIAIPIVAGIMPLSQGSQIKRFASMCGAKIPNKMNSTIERLGEDQHAVQQFGVDFATQQCEGLLKEDVAGIHFYTLNKYHSTSEIYKNLDI